MWQAVTATQSPGYYEMKSTRDRWTRRQGAELKNDRRERADGDFISLSLRHTHTHTHTHTRSVVPNISPTCYLKPQQCSPLTDTTHAVTQENRSPHSFNTGAGTI